MLYIHQEGLLLVKSGYWLSQFKRQCCEIGDVQFGLLRDGSFAALLMTDAGGDTPLSGPCVCDHQHCPGVLLSSTGASDLRSILSHIILPKMSKFSLCYHKWNLSKVWPKEKYVW